MDLKIEPIKKIFLITKNDTTYTYKEVLGKKLFPSYKIINYLNKVYGNFIEKIRTFNDNLAPFISKHVKDISQEYFDGNNVQNKAARNKYFMTFQYL